MKIGIKAGHTLTSGAVGLVKESTETREITREVTRMLQEMGHEVTQVIIDTGNATTALLNGISQLNAADCDLVMEIHLNACVQDYAGNGRTTGTEAYIYADTSSAKGYAQGIVDAIADLGYTNRGVKVNKNFTFLSRTSAPAILLECFFCDDKDDVELYQASFMAQAIVKGLTGVDYEGTTEEPTAGTAETVKEPEETVTHEPIYRVQVGAYSVKDNAIGTRDKLIEAGYQAILVQA